jgi:hypothetical protein
VCLRNADNLAESHIGHAWTGQRKVEADLESPVGMSSRSLGSDIASEFVDKELPETVRHTREISKAMAAV